MPYPVTTVTLNQNVINAALFNMIISQRVFDSGVASTEIADMFKVDGTLYGDTKLYHSFDIGAPEKWLNDAEAADLLKLNRNKSGVTQSIVMKIYQMIWITTDQYLSKQAFMLEGSFAEYTSFLKSSLRKIKKVYDNAIIKSKIGTLDPSTDACDITVTTPRGSTLEEQNRLSAQYLAARMKVLKADLEDNNRKYNKLNYLRAYNPEELVAFWNVEQSAKITMIDLPTIFHKNFGAEKPVMRQYEIPQKWFGRELTDSDGSSITSFSGKFVSVEGGNFVGSSVPAWNGGTLRIKESGWYRFSSGGNVMTKEYSPLDKPTKQTNTECFYLWAGDEVPKKDERLYDYARGVDMVVAQSAWDVNLVYAEDPSIAFVLLHKEALPYMSGFEVGTEFWNGRSLTSTNYLIFGHNELEFLEEYPRIRVKLALEAEASFEAPVQKVDIDSVFGDQSAAETFKDIMDNSGEAGIAANVKSVAGTEVEANIDGVLPVDVESWAGTSVSNNDGSIDVNVQKWNGEDTYTDGDGNPEIRVRNSVDSINNNIPLDTNEVTP